MGVLLAAASLHANRRQGYGLPRPSESSQKLFQKDLLDQSHCDDLLQEVHACLRQACGGGGIGSEENPHHNLNLLLLSCWPIKCTYYV